MKRNQLIFIVVIFSFSCLEGCLPAADSPNTFNPAPESARVDLATPTFSDSTNITNPLFPVSLLPKTILLGRVDGQPLHVEYSLLPGTRTIDWSGQHVETVVVQYVAHLNGRIEEVALDWYAQADDGSVWYFGEDVSNYQDGIVADHEGTWLAGKDGPAAMIMPADPQVGDVYRVENIPGIVFEEITVQATGVTIDGPNGPIQGAMIGEQLHMDGSYSNKTFAPGYGEFVTVNGSELEALALAVPTDALSAPAPSELDTLSSGAFIIFDRAKSKDWKTASANLTEILKAWDTHQEGNVPFMLDAQMSDAVAALIGAVNARQPAEARQAALDVAQANLDLQLQYRPPVEIDVAHFNLLTRQVLIDVEADEVAWVKSDVTTLELIRDRFVHALDTTIVADLNALLDDLRTAVENEDLEASARIAQKLFELSARLEPAIK